MFEQLLLGLEVLEDRLDDHVGAANAVAGDVGDDAIQRVACAQGVLEALGKKPGGARKRGREPLCVLVLQGHGQPAQCAPRGDVAAHSAGAYDMHVLRRTMQVAQRLILFSSLTGRGDRGKGIAVATETFQSFLQLEHADEIGRCRCLQKVRDGRRIRGRRGQRISVVFDPDIENRVRGRVMLTTRSLLHLLASLRRDDGPYGPGQRQRQGEGRAPQSRVGEENAARRVFHHARWHAFIGQSQFLRPPRVDCLPRQK